MGDDYESISSIHLIYFLLLYLKILYNNFS
jgi:hypothetical protein